MRPPDPPYRGGGWPLPTESDTNQMRLIRLTRWASDRTGDLADNITWLPGGHRLQRPLEQASIRLHKQWRRQIAKAAGR